MSFLFTWLFRGLVWLLSFFFHGGIVFLKWCTTSTIGTFLTFGVSLFVVLFSAVDWLERMIMRFMPVPADDFELDLSYVFGDLIDNYLLTRLGDDPISMVVRDLLYILNFGSFFESFLSYVVPFLLTIWVYKTVKSWLPTLGS